MGNCVPLLWMLVKGRSARRIVRCCASDETEEDGLMPKGARDRQLERGRAREYTRVLRYTKQLCDRVPVCIW